MQDKNTLNEEPVALKPRLCAAADEMARNGAAMILLCDCDDEIAASCGKVPGCDPKTSEPGAE